MIGFKFTKITEINYKEKVSWSFRSLGSSSLGKGGDSRSFPCVGDNNIKDGYLSNRFYIYQLGFDPNGFMKTVFAYHYWL